MSDAYGIVSEVAGISILGTSPRMTPLRGVT